MTPAALSSAVSQAIDASFDTRRFYFTPTAQQLGGLSIAAYRDLFLGDLGMSWESYLGFVSAAAAHNCLVLVRKTNQGVIHGFTDGKNVTGKTLATKLKSSEYPPIQSNLGFLTFLSKKAVSDRLEKPGEATYWTGLMHDQAHLDDIVHGRDAIRYTTGGQTLFDQTFIPKYLPWPEVKRLTGVDDPAPAWIAQQYTPERGATGGIQYRHTASSSAVPAGAGPDSIHFLYVKTGTFAEVEADFRNELYPRLNPQNTVEISPVRDASQEPGETWYRLYIQVPRDFTVPPALSKYAGPAVAAGLPAGNWSAVTVLAQYKVAKDADPSARPEIFYYEIVADYDVFAVAPSIHDVEMHFRARASRGLGILHDKKHTPFSTQQVSAARFFHTFSPTRGLISEFESSVRVSLNQSGAGVGWLTSVFAGVAETVLHGCEVNNYFFTESFGDLILAPPAAWPDQTREKGQAGESAECLRFRFSTDAFLRCLAGFVDEPAKTLAGQSAEWPAWSEPNTQIGRHWLCHPNLEWTTAASPQAGLEALDNFFARELRIVLQNGYSSPELLLYYGGLYRYLFLEFGKAYDHLVSHIDNAAEVSEGIKQRVKLTTKLNQIREHLAAALDCVIGHANLQRAARVDHGRRLGIYARALRAGDVDMVNDFDGEYALGRYAKGDEDLWVAWLLPRRVKYRPGLAAAMTSSLQRLRPFAALPAARQTELIERAAAQLADATEFIAESEKMDESREASVNRRRERYYPILLLWRKEMQLVQQWTRELTPHFGHKELTATLGNQRHSLLSVAQARQAKMRPHSAPVTKGTH